jgi:hypothetical protein
MKNAHTITDEGMSATLAGGSILAGTYPKRTDTVIADVLYRFLIGERLTVMDSVHSSSTTRLPARVLDLADRYGWFICREDKATGCADGRVSTVSVYWLLQSTIADANKKGAAAWCADVRAARMKRRTKAAEAKRNADAINAARMKRRDDRQADLFGGAAA